MRPMLQTGFSKWYNRTFQGLAVVGDVMNDRALGGTVLKPQPAMGSLLLACVVGLVLMRVGSADDKPTDAIPDTDLRTTPDLLRGFSEAELQAARRQIPQRPEPKLGTARPRLVTARGTVFEDLDADGQQDPGEAGIPGIVVSDGERLHRTNADGSFQFQIRIDENPHHRFVVVTRPNGFRPTTAFFQRIPFDRSETSYKVAFGMVRDAASAKRKFWFISASDSQFTRITEMIPTAKDFAQVTSAPGNPAFLATAGDLTMNGSQFEWDMYDRIRRSSRIPVYEGFGGHDGNCLDPRCTVSFEQRIGPPYYSWNYGGVHFIQIVTETFYLRPKAQLRQRDWMAADLKALPRGTPVIAVSHYPLPASWFDERRAEGVNVICQIGAHWHVVHAGSRRGVPVLNSAPARGRDWGAYSRTYRWVYVSPEGVTSRLRVAGQYKRLKVVAPGPEAVVGQQPLVVLAYDTALTVKSLTCRWTAPDGKRQVSPLEQQGDWSWHGTFAPDRPGRWTCELEAVDVAGTVWKRQQQIEVAGRQVESPEVGDDFPFVLSGSPPRRLAAGPRAPLRPLWVTHTGSVHVLHNSPVTAGGRVFVSVGNPNAGSPGAGVLCLDAKTGKRLWKAKSPRGDIRGPVSVHGDLVFAILAEGWIAAFSVETGALKWARPLKEAYREGRPLAIINTPPVPTPVGLLVNDWQKPLSIVDYATGRTLRQLAGDVGTYASFATVSDDVVYSVRRGGGTAVRLGGDLLWTIKETSRSTSAPIVVGGKLLYTGSSGLKVREAATGKLLWQKGLNGAGYQNAAPVVWDDVVLANGGDLRILDLETGDGRKTVPCGREADRFMRSRRQALTGSSTPLVAGDLAFFGHDDTSIRAINKAGNVVWEHRVGTPIKTSPAVTGNLLFVHDFAGNLWCFVGSSNAG